MSTSYNHGQKIIRQPSNSQQKQPGSPSSLNQCWRITFDSSQHWERGKVFKGLSQQILSMIVGSQEFLKLKQKG